jgi:hypothetical protein
MCSQFYGLAVEKNREDDRRKTVKRYCVTFYGRKISWVEDYEKTMYFLFGLLRAKENRDLVFIKESNGDLVKGEKHGIQGGYCKMWSY